MLQIDDETLEKLKEIARSTTWMFDQLRGQYTLYYRHGVTPTCKQVQQLILEKRSKNNSN